MNSLPGVIFGLNMHRAKSCVSARRKRIRDGNWYRNGSGKENRKTLKS